VQFASDIESDFRGCERERVVLTPSTRSRSQPRKGTPSEERIATRGCVKVDMFLVTFSFLFLLIFLPGRQTRDEREG
jgi:hypothetical protein